MRTAAILLVVILLLFLLVPLGMGAEMGRGPCPDCHAPAGLSMCVAVLLALALGHPVAAVRLRRSVSARPAFLAVGHLDRPPQASPAS